MDRNWDLDADRYAKVVELARTLGGERGTVDSRR